MYFILFSICHTADAEVFKVMSSGRWRGALQESVTPSDAAGKTGPERSQQQPPDPPLKWLFSVTETIKSCPRGSNVQSLFRCSWVSCIDDRLRRSFECFQCFTCSVWGREGGGSTYLTFVLLYNMWRALAVIWNLGCLLTRLRHVPITSGANLCSALFPVWCSASASVWRSASVCLSWTLEGEQVSLSVYDWQEISCLKCWLEWKPFMLFFFLFVLGPKTSLNGDVQ